MTSVEGEKREGGGGGAGGAGAGAAVLSIFYVLISSPGASGTKRRTITEEVESADGWELDDVHKSIILPKGLTKVDVVNSAKVVCDIDICTDCKYTTNPFEHFRKHLGKPTCGEGRLCHICNLYRADENYEKFSKFSKFAKVFLKQSRSVKKHKKL